MGCCTHAYTDQLVLMAECAVRGGAICRLGVPFRGYIAPWCSCPVLCFPAAMTRAALLYTACSRDTLALEPADHGLSPPKL